MRARFRSWWQYIRKHWVAIGVGIGLVVVIALIIPVVWFNGTGFDGYNQVTTAHTLSGPSAGTVVRTEVHQPGKALWDWMQLLIIPAVLVVGGFLLNYTTSRNEREETEKRAQTEREAAEKRAETEREISLDNQREAALQGYLDKMSELLLKEHLRESVSEMQFESKPEYDEVRKIARVRTLTVLHSLDPARKASVLSFLFESDLIRKDMGDGIISLKGADFTLADLSSANLSTDSKVAAIPLARSWMREHGLYGDLQKAKLSGVNLRGAKLRGTNLKEADLFEAYLSGADLEEANLERADLREARLRYTTLRNATLTNADLKGANLYHAVLKNANLSGAILIDADLSEADLSNANLEGVNLKDAIISITNEALEKQAKSLKGATMPDGTTHP